MYLCVQNELEPKNQFLNRFHFPVHVLENVHHQWFQVYIFSDKLESILTGDRPAPGMSTWSKLSGFINSPEVSVLYINSCFHKIV